MDPVGIRGAPRCRFNGWTADLMSAELSLFFDNLDASGNGCAQDEPWNTRNTETWSGSYVFIVGLTIYIQYYLINEGLL